MRVVRIASVLLLALLAGCDDPGSETVTPVPTPTPEPTEAAVATPSPTSSPTPSPTPSPSQQAAGTYVALGDSLAVGVGATRPEDLGYVPRIAAALGQPGAEPRVGVLRNLAVGGETSGSMIAGGQLAAALEAIRTADPPVTLVSLDIGGNDLLRLLGTEACASAPQGSDCLQLLAQTLAAFEANYRRIMSDLSTLLAEAAPGASLAVMTYFNPFSGTNAPYEAAGELALLGTDGRLDCQADDPAARGMNDIIACVGEEHGALVADVHPRFVSLGLELTHIASEDIHANDLGYEVIADAFLEVLQP